MEAADDTIVHAIRTPPHVSATPLPYTTVTAHAPISTPRNSETLTFRYSEISKVFMSSYHVSSYELPDTTQHRNILPANQQHVYRSGCVALTDVRDNPSCSTTQSNNQTVKLHNVNTVIREDMTC
ncbi:hypothetical protein RRG08_014872 [Elysia crispata]|uniref:Uncharacterized protein n=1 Tax=Elysia crispata TaxID=231223 RepID=A0AAE1AMI3_9GAST|nr:hypothetical protein RRG08_014872 [Elysia crispata]